MNSVLDIVEELELEHWVSSSDMRTHKQLGDNRSLRENVFETIQWPKPKLL